MSGKRRRAKRKKPDKPDAAGLLLQRLEAVENRVAGFTWTVKALRANPPPGTELAADRDARDGRLWRQVSAEIVKWLTPDQLEAAKLCGVEPWFYALEWINERRLEVFAHPPGILTSRTQLYQHADFNFVLLKWCGDV